MTEALGAAAMMEIPVVCIDVQRAGPATGVPTKTEQGDLWQVLGAGQGDYPRIIVAPTTIPDCFKTVPELFNLADQFQCPGIILSDLLISEGRSSIDPDELDFNVPIERGEIDRPERPRRTGAATARAYKRYEFTDSGISPRAIPGTAGLRPRGRHRRARRGRRPDQRRVHQSAQAPGHARKAHAQDGRRAAAASTPPRCSAQPTPR